MKRKTSYLLLLGVLLWLSGLACTLSPASGGSETNEEAVIAAAVATLQAQPAPVNVTAPDTPIVAGAPGVSVDLQNQLVTLYNSVNPSVVHIIGLLGTGTGFVYDSQGYVVTNNHVVDGNENLEVVFADGFRSYAEIAGTDVDSDLAVIRVNDVPENLQPVTLGDSNAVQVGEFVIAIGNPFGQESSMSLGIISGVGRTLQSQRAADGGGSYSLPQVIQTDAPINPGNSGGPLVNLSGQVIGVNSAIRTDTGFNSGVGFSIPVNAVKRIVPSLIQAGQYVYPYMGIGVSLPTLNLDAQEQLGLPQPYGVYVTSVVEEGPAAQAGLQAGEVENNFTGGDLILAVDGREVQNFDELISYLVFETEVGQTIELYVWRNGEYLTLPLTLGARP
ncbi:MAG: trypsin-like peptidase domain-containing protein [Chloroflexi bacterium]|nr:trypsin-like peptidase domain-containing protein [Chloroflexota bacterium]MBP8058369.1 trypsin-like peptidase domain-containing protein [Chloroflexota bacterium]